MAALLKVFDEHFGATAKTRTPAVELRLASERVTAREIIRRRVEAEVAERNTTRIKNNSVSRSFLVMTENNSAEAVLNPKPSIWHKPKQIDAQTEVARAIDAFQKNRFIMLLDDRQLEGLDDEVGLRPDAEIVFLFLTPLIGG